MNIKLSILPLAFGIASMVSADLYAAEGPATSPLAKEQQGAATTMEEVVVTARKRDEYNQSVPLSITAISGDALKAHGVATLEDVRFVAPSMQLSPSPFGTSVPAISIRGQRPLESIMTMDPSVGLYFNEVVVERAHGMNAALFDLQSVQVVKGPQGTLFGRNTTGGALLITPAKPSFKKTEGYVGFGFGNYGEQKLSGMLNLPVSDTVAVRFALETLKHDGYTRNLFDNTRLDDADNQSYRAAVTVKPTRDIVSTTTFQHFKENTRGNAVKLGGLNPNPAAFAFGGAALQASMRAALNFLNTQDFHSVINDTGTGSSVTSLPAERAETNHLDNITTWDIGPITLKNIIGGHTVRSFAVFDTDGTAVKLPSSIGSVLGPIGVFNSMNTLTAHQFSEEFQVMGKGFEDRLDWITGLYYFREAGRDRQLSDQGAINGNDAMVQNKSRSIFAQGTYKFESINKLSVTLGARKTWDDRWINQLSTTTPVTTAVTVCRILATATVRLNPCSRTATYSSDAPTWGVTLDYAFTPDLMTYVSRRHGYKSGGLQLRAYNFGAPTTFNPEFVDDWELGVKSMFQVAGMPARVNAAIYTQDYKDIQRTVNTPAIPPATGLNILTTNAGQATVKGGELEINLLPAKGLELSVFLNHVVPKYSVFKEPTATGGINDLSGSQFAMVPKNTAGATVKYQLPLASDIGKVSISFDWYRQSVIEITDKNVQNGVRTGEGNVPGYHVANAFVDWKDMMGKPIDLRFYVKNLSDEKYFLGGTTIMNSLGFYNVILGAPRTYGAELKYRF